MADYPTKDGNGATIIAFERDPAYVPAPFDLTGHYPVYDGNGDVIVQGGDEATPPTGPSITAPGSIDVSTFKIGTAHTITAGTASATGGGTVSYEYRWLVAGASAASTAAYTPLAANDTDSIAAQWRAVETGGTNAGATSWQTVASGTITRVAPVAAAGIADQTFSIDTGVQTVDISGDFTGDDLTFSLPTTITGVTINASTGVISVDTDVLSLQSATSIVYRATNSGGSDDAGFGLTISDAQPSLREAQVATRCFFPSNLTAAHVETMARSAHFARDAITSLKLVFVDAYGASETASGATTTITASIEYPSGTFTQVEFGASASGSLLSGGTLVSDAVSVSIPDGAQFWVRQYRVNANGLIYNLYSRTSATLGDAVLVGASGISDATMGGAITGTAGQALVTPAAIIAQTRKPAVFIAGDSKAIGVGDIDGGNAVGDGGEIARTIGPEFGYINAGIAGERASTFATSGGAKRIALARDYCSHVIANYGINDAENGGTLAGTKDSLQTFWGLWQDVDAIFHATIAPKTTSTDDWATLVNQTVSPNNAVRTGLNTFLRTTPDNLAGFIEIADVVESARDSGLWAAGLTDDGIHENQAGYEAIVTASAISTAAIVRPDALVNPTEADIWLSKFAVAPDASRESLYSAWVDGLVSDGVFAKLDILYLTGASDIKGSRVNVIDPGKFMLTRYDDPTWTADAGFRGNGANELSTNYVPSRDGDNYTLNSASMFLWNDTNVRQGAFLGGYGSSGSKAYINPHNASSDTMSHALNNGSWTNSFAPGGSDELFTLSREASTGYKLYRNATLLGTASTASTSVPTQPLYLCSGGGIYFDSTRTISVYGAGAGLTAADVTALHSRTSTLISGIGAL